MVPATTGIAAARAASYIAFQLALDRFRGPPLIDVVDAGDDHDEHGPARLLRSAITSRANRARI